MYIQFSKYDYKFNHLFLNVIYGNVYNYLHALSFINSVD